MRKAYYRKIVKQYLPLAEEHFLRCGISPDAEDLASCIYEFWDQDTGTDLEPEDYEKILLVLENE
jgi:hypothetical protein